MRCVILLQADLTDKKTHKNILHISKFKQRTTRICNQISGIRLENDSMEKGTQSKDIFGVPFKTKTK